MVAERDRVTPFDGSSVDSVLAGEILWFVNKLGPEVVGEEVIDQVNNPQLYSAIVLNGVASGKMSIEDRFPTLYNILPSGVPVMLKELGFIRGEAMEFVHPDKPFVAKVHHLSDNFQDGLFNTLSIRRYP